MYHNFRSVTVERSKQSNMTAMLGLNQQQLAYYEPVFSKIYNLVVKIVVG